MPILNLDKLKQKKAECSAAIVMAMKEQDENKLDAALDGYSQFISEAVQTELTAAGNGAIDTVVLATRGIRQLTQAETDFYTKFIEAAKASDPKQAIKNVNEAIPVTVIDTVIDDIRKAHPLLDRINFRNTSLYTKYIYNKTTEIVPLICNSIIENIPLLIDAGLQLFVSLTEALPDAIVQIVAALPEIINGIISALLEAIPQIIQAGIDLFVALIGALPEIITTIVEALPQIITGIVTALAGAYTQLVEAGMDLFLGLIGALPDIIIAIVNALPQITDGIVDGLIEAAPQLAIAGLELFISMVSNLPKIIMEIVSVIPKIVKGIVDGFKERINDIKNIGSNIMAGIGDGIIAGVTAVKDKINAAGEKIMNAFKDFFDIHSPSAKMKKEIGLNLADGVGIGFTERMSKISADMQKAVPTSFDLDVEVDAAATRRRKYGNAQTETGGSFSFVQNNYSPKNISAAESARLAKQALQLAHVLR